LTKAFNASKSYPMSQSRHLVQVTPESAGGVMDYALCLQRHWCDMGITTQMVALSEASAKARPLADQLRNLSPMQNDPLTVLLHYSGYGFNDRGLCYWLVRELDEARSALNARLRVVTIFHELFASGPPWSSAFWLSSAQAWITSRIARSSDQLITNSQHHARCLHERLCARAPVQVWPVFSTIGEPVRVTPADHREPRLAVFGSESTRRRALAKLPRHTVFLKQLGVETVSEAGSGASALPSDCDIECRFEGHLNEHALSVLLQESAFAMIDYPSIHLSKSTVFAAYAVHGCVVLNTAPAGPDADGLVDGQHFLTLVPDAGVPVAAAARRTMSSAGRDWYAGHPLATQAASLADLCEVKYGMEPVNV
jgi:hypothetical protein